MISVQGWASIREALYSYTGIDFGLAMDPEDLARLVRKHAALIGELVDLPKDQRFTAQPNPNWAFPSPVEGRTKTRKERLPGDGMRMKVRGIYLELVNMETSTQAVVARPEQEEAIEFFQHWNEEVLTGAEGSKDYSAQVDTGTHFYTLVGVWPWTFRAGLVAFRYAKIEDVPTSTQEEKHQNEELK